MSSTERFEFFATRIAKLRLWDDGRSFLCLKGLAQVHHQAHAWSESETDGA